MVLNENVDIKDITSAINNHQCVIINYDGDDNTHRGARLIEIYAYGMTKAGNPVIRAFERTGDTKTTVPHWKMFRLDRISGWKPTNQTFDQPANVYYPGMGDFNPTDDKTMSVVYQIASFGDTPIQKDNSTGVKLKDDAVYQTDTEKSFRRLRQQVNNPITIDDLKSQQPDQTTGVKLKDGSTTATITPTEEEPFKTDTERNMERLRKQLENPITLDDYLKRKETPNTNTSTQSLRDRLGDTSEPIPFAELNRRLDSTNNSDETSVEEEPFKTDTERNMERLRKQLDNPHKIDLSRIPKR